ncbi:MAG: preprotein translocase subunit SecE [Candidatus Gastranaerophilaceae bacterium]|jgi:preprotein translocase subunit SecE
MSGLKKINTFVKDIWIELSQKMTWPSRKQLVDMTAVVVIFVVLWAFYVGVLDFAFAKGFEKFLDYAHVTTSTSAPSTTTPGTPQIPVTPVVPPTTTP